MSEAAGQVSQAVYPLLKEIVDAWYRRDEFRASKESGSLGFWRDGMLVQLRRIADGDKNTKTFKELTMKFNESKRRVARLIESLRVVRNDLGRSRISDQIDIILNDAEFGKNKIRHDIDCIIDCHKAMQPSILKRIGQAAGNFLVARADDDHRVSVKNSEEAWQDIKSRAQSVCRAIDTLNGEIGRLHRLVYPA